MNKNILNDTYLNATEKVILLLMLTTDQEVLDEEFLLKRLGCDGYDLQRAFNRLVKAGYLKDISVSSKDMSKNVKEDSSVIKDQADYQKIELRDFGDQNYERNLDFLHELIDEPLNDRQARIILNIAKGDLKRIEDTYKKAKKSQFSDKLGILIKDLQASSQDDKQKPKKIRTQVNYKKLTSLKKYQQQKDY